MNNFERYFSSNTKLQFLPGNHYLAKNLIVNFVSNFSVWGDTTNNTTIYCNTQAKVFLRNSININIKNLTIKNCGYSNSVSKDFTKLFIALILYNCTNFVIQNSVIECDCKQCGLVVIDVKGYSKLNNIKSGQLMLVHNYTTRNTFTQISYYEQSGCCINDTAIKVIMHQHLYKVTVNLFHVALYVDKPLSIYCSNCKGQNFIIIKEMKLIGTTFSQHIIDVALDSCKRARTHYNLPLGSIIEFIDCNFVNITGTYAIISIQTDLSGSYSVVHTTNSSFRHINANGILSINLKNIQNHDSNLHVVIQNTAFSVINVTTAVIYLEESLKGIIYIRTYIKSNNNISNQQSGTL